MDSKDKQRPKRGSEGAALKKWAKRAQSTPMNKHWNLELEATFSVFSFPFSFFSPPFFKVWPFVTTATFINGHQDVRRSLYTSVTEGCLIYFYRCSLLFSSLSFPLFLCQVFKQAVSFIGPVE